MAIKLLYFLALWALEKWACGVIQLDRDSWRFLVNSVDNEARYIPVSNSV